MAPTSNRVQPVTPKANNTHPPPLLALPPELRVKIYDHLFRPATLNLNPPIPSRSQLEPPLAQISQLRDEVLPEYYKRITCMI